MTEKKDLEENEEEIIAQIGQTWSRSLLTDGCFYETSIAVTKSHLFAVGNCIGKGGVTGYQTLDVDLVNVSTISFTKITDGVKILVAFLFVFPMIPLLPMLLLGELNSEANVVKLLLIICSLIVIWCAISAIKHVMLINVQGVTYNYEIESVSDDTAQMFVREVVQLADVRRKEEKQGIVGVAPVDTAKEVTMTKDVTMAKEVTTTKEVTMTKEVTITKEKINLLKSLYEEGLITKEEFLAKVEEQLKAL